MTPPGETSPSTPPTSDPAAPEDTTPGGDDPRRLDDAAWRERLTPEQFQVLRRQGTEPPWSGIYARSKEPGLYRCAACGAALFASATKYESGTGWPSFWEPVDAAAVELRSDTSHGMVRTEVVCARCGGHLGHVFPDGPRPTGERYCINSLALDLDRDAEATGDGGGRSGAAGGADRSEATGA